MSAIDQILSPTVLSSLREDIPPVKCIVWKGNNYETIEFEVYPFDTLNNIKQMICTHYKGDSTFIPKFVFVGIPIESNYEPLDYLWYPNGTNDPKKTYILKNPINLESDVRFISSDGSWASPNNESRGRSLLEQVFLQNIPVLHVFPLAFLLKKYSGPTPISEEDWNKRFAPYYPDIKVEGPYRADEEDIEFSKKIHYFIQQREKSIDLLNRYLEEAVEIPLATLTGIRQLSLTWKKPVSGFEGCGYMFYRLQVTEKRPFLRLLPSEGSAVTKLHIKGVLPIPSLEDPKILEQWSKELSPTHGIDFCIMKYIHRPSLGITPPIYGTIQICNDGTINLLLLPPKQTRKLDPKLDFRNFNSILTDVFKGLPQDFNKFQLREISTLFTLKLNIKSKKMNKTRILQRLPYFQIFFQEIKPLPNETPIISLRYKAVSQYASEDKTFTFLTQFSTTKMLDGESATTEQITALQNEFQLSRKEAIEIIAKWFEQRGTFTVQIPDDGEFIENFNPGIDIHIYAQHPSYYFHINRIDSFESYNRIYTLLSLLFIEDDGYFSGMDIYEIDKVSSEIEQDSINKEPEPVPMQSVSTIPDWIMDDPFADENDAIAMNTIPEEKEQKEEQKGQEQKGQERKEEEDKIVNPKSWFIKKLQEIDPRLFSFKTEDADDNGYSRKCAGYDDRQPSVLSKDQYERMREIYENDRIHWIEYPLEGTDEPIQPLGTEETVNIMRYGSYPDSINYYFCPQYYCLSDEIMIRPKDFEATVDRNGAPKSPNTCPFCYGKLITDKKKGNIGYTVIKRKDKKGATYHSYIDFMTKTTHPEGFALPCCFLKQTTLRIKDKRYDHLRSFLQEAELEEEIDENEYEDLILKGDEPIEYAVLFESLYKKYIIESNKHPDSGVFALIPSNFDVFFRQKSNNIITRVAIHLKLRPNAEGFLRIGTHNSHNESLLGVIAPLIYKNSIEEVKIRIIEKVTPSVFINSHFGNLVIEFYDPADENAMPKTQNQLSDWASFHLGISYRSTNSYALIRIYNSYHRFIDFIQDPMQRKDLRHIQPILSEPNLITTRGIQLIVLEDTEPVSIKCPAFGVSIDRNKNDFAFVSRSLKNMGSNKYAKYELYFHTSNKPGKGGENEIHETIVRWNYASRKVWPEIVKHRVDEFMTQCQSRYRSIYTSQDGINQMALIPLSNAVNTLSAQNIDGIIKDSYNHIVGITIRAKGSLITLPVVDDGVISISSAFSIKNIYLDWDDYKSAPADVILAYYRTNLEPLFGLYPGYKIQHAVKKIDENKIIALQLENGIYIPASPPKEDIDLNIVTVKQFEWSINKEIAGISSNWNKIIEGKENECGVDTAVRESTNIQFEELYQQFRLMVSNWLTSYKAGSGIRKDIEDIIFNSNLPEYEKRKRMHIYISSTFISWFYADKEKWESPVSFLRKDCRLIDNEEACSGTCFWKEEGKCSLHVDAMTKVGGKNVSTPELFTKRIIDELVRFPIRRKQLMTKGDISKISVIVQPIRQGDQYIIPESSPTWTNLLRLDWAKQIPEEPKYYEEMSRDEEEKKREELPQILKDILGDTHLTLHVSDSFDAIQSVLGVSFDKLGIKDINKDNLAKYVKYTSKPIGMIDLNNNDIKFVRPFSGSFSYVMILVLSDKIGILMDDENYYVNITSLPESLKVLYNKASLVRVEKAPEVINTKKHVPLIAAKVSEPLVIKGVPRKRVISVAPAAPKKRVISVAKRLNTPATPAKRVISVKRVPLVASKINSKE